MHAVIEGKAKLLIFAFDTSERLRLEFKTAMEKRKTDIPVFHTEISIDEIHFSCGYKAGVIAVLDENFSKIIISLLED